MNEQGSTNERDLINILNSKLEGGKKVLILGCGLSNHETFKCSKAKEVILNIFNYSNLTVSDVEINSQIGQLGNNGYFDDGEALKSEKNYQKFFPENYSTFKDQNKKSWSGFFNKTFEEVKSILPNRFRIKEHIEERFVKFDLLAADNDWTFLKEYDYIDLRYVIHFKTFENKKIEVLKKIYDNMKFGAKLGIQCYSRITDEQEHKEEYSELNEKEAKDIRKMSTSKEVVVEYFSVDNGNKAVKIIMTK